MKEKVLKREFSEIKTENNSINIDENNDISSDNPVKDVTDDPR